MRKLIAVVLSMAIFMCSSISTFAESIDAPLNSMADVSSSVSEDSAQDETQSSPNSTEESENDIAEEICGYKIPKEPNAPVDPDGAFSYESEGDTYTILSCEDENCGMVKLYRNGILRQKTIGDQHGNVIYTEWYHIEPESNEEEPLQVTDESSALEYDAEEPEIKEENGFVYITVHKPVSSEALPLLY